MSGLPGPEHVWVFIALIAGATVVGCLHLIAHASHDAIRWHDLRVDVQRLRAEQQRRLDKLARIEAGVNERPQRGKRQLPDNLREPVAAAEIVDAVEMGEGEPLEIAEAVEMAEAA